MRWTPKGANALLHIRVANPNDELGNALKERKSAIALGRDPRMGQRSTLGPLESGPEIGNSLKAAGST